MQKRDHSKMLTIAPKMEQGHGEKIGRLNLNILGYIAAGISLIAILAKGAKDTKTSKQK